MTRRTMPLEPQPPTSGNAAVLHRLVEGLPSAAAYLEGDRLFLNRAAEKMTGYDSAELRTLREWFTRLFPGQTEGMRAVYRCREEGFTRTERVWLIRKDGD